MMLQPQPSSILFFSTLILSSLLAMTSSSPILIWLALEMNIMSFIPLMITSQTRAHSVTSIKYFVIQAPTTILIMSMIFISLSKLSSSSEVIMFSLIFMKLGIAPFHIWFIQVTKKLDWLACLLMLTWQKMIPLYIMSLFSPLLFSPLILISTMNSVVGGVGGLAQTKTRPLLAYSSLSHFSWMLAAYLMNWETMMIYFLFYTMMSVFVLLPMSKANMLEMKFKNMERPHKENQIAFWLDMMSLAGIPPLLGFIPKMMVITNLVLYSPVFLLFITMMSIIPLFFYLRVASTMMVNTDMSVKTQENMSWAWFMMLSRVPIFIYFYWYSDFNMSFNTMKSNNIHLMLKNY